MTPDEKINLLHLALQESIITYEAKVKDFKGNNNEGLQPEDIISYKEKVTFALNELSVFQKLLENDESTSNHSV